MERRGLLGILFQSFCSMSHLLAELCASPGRGLRLFS